MVKPLILTSASFVNNWWKPPSGSYPSIPSKVLYRQTNQTNGMLRDFRDFIIKQNFLALAVAVVLGGAVGKVVQAVVDDFVMPIIAAGTPGGEWQKAKWDVGPVSFGIGDFAAVFLNFLIVAFVVWRIAKLFEKPAPAAAPVRNCQFCKMEIAETATRCPHCTSQL